MRDPHMQCPDKACQAKQDAHWKQRPESFAKFYRRPSLFSPAGVVSRFLDDRTAALETFIDCHEAGRLLDVGCGSGVHMIRFLDRFAHVAGVDYSKAMIALARNALIKNGRDNWELKCADAASLPFPDKSFDVVIGMGLLDYVSSVSDAIAEFTRVLSPGGQIIVTVPKSPSLFSPLRSPAGNLVKRWLFNLPPVGNVQTRKSLQTLFDHSGLKLQAVRPLWTAMWMVKALKE
ncbi:MAG: class I SAM-dependent methyltransferase [Candidatus Peribacteraceae bacterium]